MVIYVFQSYIDISNHNNFNDISDDLKIIESGQINQTQIEKKLETYRKVIYFLDLVDCRSFRLYSCICISLAVNQI